MNSNFINYNSSKDNNNNIGYMIRNSASNATNTSSMKKCAKKLSILNGLDKSNNQYNLNSIFNQKTNSLMPIKTNASNELLANENE